MQEYLEDSNKNALEKIGKRLSVENHFIPLLRKDPTLFKAAKAFLMINNRKVLPWLPRDVCNLLWKHLTDAREIRYVLGEVVSICHSKGITSISSMTSRREYLESISTKVLLSACQQGEVVLFNTIASVTKASKKNYDDLQIVSAHHPQVIAEQPIYAVAIEKENIKREGNREKCDAEHLVYHRVCLPNYPREYDDNLYEEKSQSKCIIA